MFIAPQNPTNLFEFAVTLFNKAISGSYPAHMGQEPIRQAIIDFEGPTNRGRLFDLDHTSFYYLQFRGRDYWLGICEDINKPSAAKSETVSKYSELFRELGKIIVIPPVNTASGVNTMKFIKVMHDLLLDIIYPDDACDGEYLCQIKFAIMHIITWYIYNNTRINLTKPDTFRVAFIDTGIAIDNDTYYKFFEEDFKYCDTLSRDFPNKYKLLGSFNRWRNKYSNTVPPVAPPTPNYEEETNE